MGKQYIASRIMFAKILERVDEDGAEVIEEGVDDDHAEGGGVHRRRFR
jgi:hypothetical protein